MVKLIVFDIETTGLPKTPGFGLWYPYTSLDKYNSSRIISISWKVIEDKKSVVKEFIIKPNGFTIPKAATAIHRISNTIAQTVGIDLHSVLKVFCADLEEADILIGHNVWFDINITKAELVRLDMFEEIHGFEKVKIKDTMKMGKRYLKQWKMPKLSELYQALFEVKTSNLHNARVDVQYTHQCYDKLIQLGF